jgi:hypothetical protein
VKEAFHFYALVHVEAVEGGVMTGANLFNLAKTVDLTRRPTREPNRIDAFFLGWICVHVGVICRGGPIFTTGSNKSIVIRIEKERVTS